MLLVFPRIGSIPGDLLTGSMEVISLFSNFLTGRLQTKSIV